MAKEVSIIPTDMVYAMARPCGTILYMHHYTDSHKELTNTVLPTVEYLYEMEVNEEQLEGFELGQLNFLIRHSMADADYLRSTPAYDGLWNFTRRGCY